MRKLLVDRTPMEAEGFVRTTQQQVGTLLTTLPNTSDSHDGVLEIKAI